MGVKKLLWMKTEQGYNENIRADIFIYFNAIKIIMENMSHLEQHILSLPSTFAHSTDHCFY
jgi:hypothetical protein